MKFSIVFIPCMVASCVHCAREPPAYFFNGFDEESCVKLNHVLSHINHREKMAMSLDMICEVDGWYLFASFASPLPALVRAAKHLIRITKVDHDLTVIKFISATKHGVATLYFESLEDAKNFNRGLYPPLRERLEHVMKVGKIERILDTGLIQYPIATQFADIYYERKSDPLKFVIEADGNREPALLFMQGEFNLTVEKRKGDSLTILKLGRTSMYFISFDDNGARQTFTSKIGKLIGLRAPEDAQTTSRIPETRDENSFI